MIDAWNCRNCRLYGDLAYVCIVPCTVDHPLMADLPFIPIQDHRFHERRPTGLGEGNSQTSIPRCFPFRSDDPGYCSASRPHLVDQYMYTVCAYVHIPQSTSCHSAQGTRLRKGFTANGA